MTVKLYHKSVVIGKDKPRQKHPATEIGGEVTGKANTTSLHFTSCD